MLNNKFVAVVVPAYNEQDRIGIVIRTMPEFVDRIIIINDGSTDRTADIVKGLIESEVSISPRIPTNKSISDHSICTQIGLIDCTIDTADPDTGRLILISHYTNSGKGAGIKTGYLYCRQLEIDCVATMDGDGQMNPEELQKLCEPVVFEDVDYVKGNRLDHKDAWRIIPKIRIWGNLMLSAITRPCSGYWKISDTQTGFTAISKNALNRIPVERIYPYYGYPNDILVKLNIHHCTIREVTVQPIYHHYSESKMKIYQVIPRITWLLFRSFFGRLWSKYGIVNPVFFFYHLSVLGAVVSIPGIFLLLFYKFSGNTETGVLPIVTLSAMLTALGSFIAAVCADILDNRKLYR